MGFMRSEMEDTYYTDPEDLFLGIGITDDINAVK
jgi:hypothetical protein